MKAMTSLVAMMLLSACTIVSPEKFVKPSAITTFSSNGYVAGMFSGTGGGFGFDLVDVNSKREYLLPFFDPHYLIAAQDEEIRLIELPPGRYTISHWTVYGGLTNERTSKKAFGQPDQAQAIDINRGRVNFIGRYRADQEYVESTKGSTKVSTRTFKISPVDIRKDDFITKFKAKYPGFPIESIDYCAAFICRRSIK
jgi:hypothetical protein